MFTVCIETDNAAFTDHPATEIARILREIAKDLEDGVLQRRYRDVNGNTVAFVTVKVERRYG